MENEIKELKGKEQGLESKVLDLMRDKEEEKKKWKKWIEREKEKIEMTKEIEKKDEEISMESVGGSKI